MGRQLVQVGVVTADAQHRHGGMALLQGTAGGAQLVEADVESHVGRRLQGLQQGPHLAQVAGPEFHQHGGGGDAFRQRPGQLRGPLPQQGGFLAREAVFGLLADRLKEAGALRVVEQPGGQLPRLPRHSFEHQPLQIGGGGMEIEQFRRLGSRQGSNAARRGVGPGVRLQSRRSVSRQFGGFQSRFRGAAGLSNRAVGGGPGKHRAAGSKGRCRSYRGPAQPSGEFPGQP